MFNLFFNYFLKNEPEASRYCNVLKDHKLFKQCSLAVDVTPFVDACKYDLCSDSNQNHKDLYGCSAFAAYAYECASKGVLLDWINQDDLSELKTSCFKNDYAKCYGESTYSECSRKFNSTCKDLTTKTNENRSSNFTLNCVPGCTCPNNYYFDNVNGYPQCVKMSSCSCYDLSTNKYYSSNDKIQKGCQNW